MQADEYEKLGSYAMIGLPDVYETRYGELIAPCPQVWTSIILGIRKCVSSKPGSELTDIVCTRRALSTGCSHRSLIFSVFEDVKHISKDLGVEGARCPTAVFDPFHLVTSVSTKTDT